MSERKVKKHPDVIAWEKWKQSVQGALAMEGNAGGVYLQNRLWDAFMAGRRSKR